MNERFDVIVTILELIGTAAFAASGALTAIVARHAKSEKRKNAE